MFKTDMGATSKLFGGNLMKYYPLTFTPLSTLL